MAESPARYTPESASAIQAYLDDLSVALASMMAALAAGTFLLSILWGLGVEVPLPFPPVILAVVCLPLFELTVFARIGRAAEWRRDLGPATRRG